DIEVNKGIAANMLNYIQSSLDQGYPVLVGVNAGYVSDINDGVTDHFLVMVGYETDSMGNPITFIGLDNATSNVSQIEFSVGEDSKIFKPVLGGTDRTGSRYIDDNIYVVTQVRVWDKVKPKNRSGVWGKW